VTKELTVTQPPLIISDRNVGPLLLEFPALQGKAEM
jgi:hypothetical protein